MFAAAQTVVHLLYHELDPAPGDYLYALGTAEFARHCELYQSLAAAPVQPVITFDDGHRSFHDHAVPFLARHGLHAHSFITAGWTGQRTGYMDWPELRAVLAAGHRIGAHGWSHALLTGCSDAELRHELRDTRDLLQQHLGTEITSLSFPGGRFNRRVLAAAHEAGYTELYTSEPRAERMPLRELRGRVNLRQNTSTATLEALLAPASPALRRLGQVDRVKVMAKAVLGDRRYARLWAMLNRHPAETEPAEAER